MKNVIKVGQLINLEMNEGRSVRLHATASREGVTKSWLTKPRVRVKAIGFGRRDLRANAVWLEVESVHDPLVRGWVPFDCGGWDQGMRLRITSLSFEDSRPSPVKVDASCVDKV